MPVDKSAGVRDGMEALAFGETETPSDRAGGNTAVWKLLLTTPADFLQRAKFLGSAPKGARRTRRQHSCGSLITAIRRLRMPRSFLAAHGSGTGVRRAHVMYLAFSPPTFKS